MLLRVPGLGVCSQAFYLLKEARDCLCVYVHFVADSIVLCYLQVQFTIMFNCYNTRALLMCREFNVQACKIMFYIIQVCVRVRLSSATCNKAKVDVCANASPFSGDF